jgi:hypothetical protein
MPHTTSLDDYQVKHFFEIELGMPEATVERLAEEGVERPEDLVEFSLADVKTMVANLRRPGGSEPDGDAGGTVPTFPFKFGAKAMLRLQNACDVAKCYETLRCDMSADMLVCDPAIKNFKLEHDALIERKKQTVVTPRMSSNLNVVKWTESFLDFLSRLVGVRNMPLTYVVRETVEVDIGTEVILLNGCCYTEESGSIEQELIIRASHKHPLCKDDNARMYFLLEEATRSTSYAASIKPFQKKRNGRDAWFSIKKTTRWGGQVASGVGTSRRLREPTKMEG